jgi:hypothetical protein
MLIFTYKSFMQSVFMLSDVMLSIVSQSQTPKHCSTQEGSSLTRKYKTFTDIIVSVS